MLNADARAALTQLVQRYHSTLDKKRADLRAAYDEAEAGEWSDDALAPLKLLVHRMAGSAASYGFTDLGETARMLDQSLFNLGDLPADERGDVVAERFARLIEELTACINRPPPGDPHAESQIQSDRRLSGMPRVVLVDDDPRIVEILSRQLMSVGFDVRGFTDAFQAMDSVNQIRPVAILMDLMFSEGEDYGFQIAEAMVARLRYKPGLIFLSARTDVRARRWAVDSGADAFFTKPVNVSALAQLLEQFASDRVTEDAGVAGRVAIIEDDPQIGQYYSNLLTGSGFATDVIAQPERALDRLLDFQPHLVLMDMQMPELDGIELTQILRQHEALFDVPVLFLTSVTDPERLRSAVRAGADALLSKSDDPELVLSVVQRRVRRFRRVTFTLTRDPLTRLFNRPALMERVSFEMQRAQRNGEAFCVGILDIDGFGAFNREHGRMAGDQLLRSVTQAVQARMRQVDVIGRFGGDEIMIIMPATRQCSGEAVVREVMNRISEQTVLVGDQTLSVTASGAVVEGQLGPHDSSHYMLQRILAKLEALLSGESPATLNSAALTPEPGESSSGEQRASA